MNKYIIKENISVLGKVVDTFPKGISEAFDQLAAIIGDNCTFYGICKSEKGNPIYIAAAEKKMEEEAIKHGYSHYSIECGSYLSTSINGWNTSLPSIKKAFEELLQNELADHTKPLIEIYLDQHEMLCLVRTDERKEVLSHFDTTMQDLLASLVTFQQDAFNIKPSENRWSAAQVAEHLLKSYQTVSDTLKGPHADTDRYYNENTEQIKNIFLDFDNKLQSPEFIIPEEMLYDQAALLNLLRNTLSDIRSAFLKTDITKTCTFFTLPVLGHLTCLEWMYFIIYHTQRHIHQIKNIKESLRTANLTNVDLT